MNLHQAVQEAGLTKREAAVYLFLLEKGPSSPSAVAVGTRIARPNIYDVSRSLAAKGLLRSELRTGRRLVSAERPVALERLARQKLGQVRQLLPLLGALECGEGFGSKVSFYEGRRAMRNLMDDALSSKKKEIWYLWSPTDMNKILGKKRIEEFIKERLSKGIMIRSLRPAEKESLYGLESTDEYGKRMTQVGYIPGDYTFTLSLALYDSKVAFFSSEKESYGFLVESKEFSQVIRMLYESLWRGSGKLRG